MREGKFGRPEEKRLISNKNPFYLFLSCRGKKREQHRQRPYIPRRSSWKKRQSIHQRDLSNIYRGLVTVTRIFQAYVCVMDVLSIVIIITVVVIIVIVIVIIVIVIVTIIIVIVIVE